MEKNEAPKFLSSQLLYARSEFRRTRRAADLLCAAGFVKAAMWGLIGLGGVLPLLTLFLGALNGAGAFFGLLYKRRDRR